jgi:hypothetical protein
MSHGTHILPDATEAEWRTSSYSGGQGDCVEVALSTPSLTPVRDSKRPAGPVLAFSHHAWSAFLTHLG